MIESLPAEEVCVGPRRGGWEARAAAHRVRVAPYAEAFVERRARGLKHPVWDFLFTYYSFSPNKLMTWCPAVFEEDTEGKWEWPPLTARDVKQAQWIAQLCENIVAKPARFQCHGLHEWAMVYKQSAEQVRHNGYRLRLTPEALAAFVESQQVCCTHYDAFRFFAPEARPLNIMKPRLETRLELEQGGCLHTNMDLYKWSYKLWPWIGSELVADAFLLALGGRELDMRASPYDLADLGFEPIAIETEAGREEYRRAQQELAERAAPARAALRDAALRIADC
jgi:hypothetical protein